MTVDNHSQLATFYAELSTQLSTLVQVMQTNAEPTMMPQILAFAQFCVTSTNDPTFALPKAEEIYEKAQQQNAETISLAQQDGHRIQATLSGIRSAVTLILESLVDHRKNPAIAPYITQLETVSLGLTTAIQLIQASGGRIRNAAFVKIEADAQQMATQYFGVEPALKQLTAVAEHLPRGLFYPTRVRALLADDTLPTLEKLRQLGGLRAGTILPWRQRLDQTTASIDIDTTTRGILTLLANFRGENARPLDLLLKDVIEKSLTLNLGRFEVLQDYVGLGRDVGVVSCERLA